MQNERAFFPQDPVIVSLVISRKDIALKLGETSGLYKHDWEIGYFVYVSFQAYPASNCFRPHTLLPSESEPHPLSLVLLQKPLRFSCLFTCSPVCYSHYIIRQILLKWRSNHVNAGLKFVKYLLKEKTVLTETHTLWFSHHSLPQRTYLLIYFPFTVHYTNAGPLWVFQWPKQHPHFIAFALALPMVNSHILAICSKVAFTMRSISLNSNTKVPVSNLPLHCPFPTLFYLHE